MWLYLAKRVGTAAFILLALTLVVFVVSRIIPNDPAVVFVGPKAPPEELERVRESLGLNNPLYVQYFSYLGGLLRGDWGTSLATKVPVLPDMMSRLPATLELIGVAMGGSILIGIALGVLAARRPGRIVDGIVRFLAIGGVAIPAFWLGLLLQLLFVGQFKLLPATGQFSTSIKYESPIEPVTGFSLFDSLITGNMMAFTDGISHIILPAITLAAYPVGVIARMTRASLLEVNSMDYVFTARAFRLPERVILWKLALKNAMPPTLTVIGLATAYAFFVEIVFNWPGIGQYATSAMLAVDYPVIMAITLLGATGYIITNLIVDILQARIDPRVRLS
jgi:ABC-type dipeptide/oligopeptide/nickel transport system permease component